MNCKPLIKPQCNVLSILTKDNWQSPSIRKTKKETHKFIKVVDVELDKSWMYLAHNDFLKKHNINHNKPIYGRKQGINIISKAIAFETKSA